MQTNAPNMSKGAQVALAAMIGGSAKALSGGKPARLCRNNAPFNARIIRRGGVANGAVTGAYVMMLNHLGDNHTKAKSELQAKLTQAIEEQRRSSSKSDPFNVEINNPFAIDFTLNDFVPSHSISRDVFENIELQVVTGGNPEIILVDVHLRTASSPANENYNTGVQIIPVNSSKPATGNFALPKGYNVAIFNGVSTRYQSGSAILFINFKSQKTLNNFMKYVNNQ